MITLLSQDGEVDVNTDHIIYYVENEDPSADPAKWVEMYLTTEQVLEIYESIESVREKIKNEHTVNGEA